MRLRLVRGVIDYDEQREQFWTPGGHPVTLHIRAGTNDHNTAFSCLDEDEYALPSGLSGIAWDIGGYIGAVTIALALDNPDLRIITVEPVPANCDILWRNVLQAGVEDRVALIRGAVGAPGQFVDVAYGYKGSEAAEHHAFVGNSTLALGTDHETITYPATTVDELLEAGSPAFVKIDTEGAEWDFLPGISVPLIVGEWHPTKGDLGAFIALLPDYDVVFTGPQVGPGGFRATAK